MEGQKVRKDFDLKEKYVGKLAQPLERNALGPARARTNRPRARAANTIGVEVACIREDKILRTWLRRLQLQGEDKKENEFKSA